LGSVTGDGDPPAPVSFPVRVTESSHSVGVCAQGRTAPICSVDQTTCQRPWTCSRRQGSPRPTSSIPLLGPSPSSP